MAVPKNVEHYLAVRFGEHYMRMPDEKTKALYQEHADIWDTEKDYTAYLAEETKAK